MTRNLDPVAPHVNENIPALPGSFTVLEHEHLWGAMNYRARGSRYLKQIFAAYRAAAFGERETHARGRNWTSKTTSEIAQMVPKGDGTDTTITRETVSRARAILKAHGLIYPWIDRWGHTHTWVAAPRTTPRESAAEPVTEPCDRNGTTCSDQIHSSSGTNGMSDAPDGARCKSRSPGDLDDSVPGEQQSEFDQLTRGVKATALVAWAEAHWPNAGQGDAYLTEHQYSRGRAIAFVRKLLVALSAEELMDELDAYTRDDRCRYMVPLDTWFGFTRRRWFQRDPKRKPPVEWRQKLIDFHESRRAEREAKNRAEHRAHLAAQRRFAAYEAMVSGAQKSGVFGGDEGRRYRLEPTPTPPPVKPPGWSADDEAAFQHSRDMFAAVLDVLRDDGE